jgi:septum formation protein
MKIVLASQSTSRQHVLQMIGLDFEVVPSQIDESQVKITDPAKRAKHIAQFKAEAVAKNHPGLIIAADTYSFLGQQIFEKPKTKSEAKKMLSFLSGKELKSVTGLCLINTKTGEKINQTKVTQVWFRKLSDGEIKQVVKTEPVLTWAAAYAPFESKTVQFIDKISGSFSGLVYGLPLELVVPFLQKYKLFN